MHLYVLLLVHLDIQTPLIGVFKMGQIQLFQTLPMTIQQLTQQQPNKFQHLYHFLILCLILLRHQQQLA